MAMLHTSKKQEDSLRGIGFDIPLFPKTGEVRLGGRVVGYIDNFSGLVTRDREAMALIFAVEDKFNLAIWNRSQVD